MPCSGMLRHTALVRTDVSEERLVFLRCVLQLLVTANIVPSWLILSTLIIEAMFFPKHRSLQQLHSATSQKTVLFDYEIIDSNFQKTLGKFPGPGSHEIEEV
jgi:hypothetical protein